MDIRTCILVGTLATAALGGVACDSARFSLLGGRQDAGVGGTAGPAASGGVGPGGSTNADAGRDTASTGGT